MRRSAQAAVLVIVLLGAIMPAAAAPAASTTTYSGKTSSRALDLSVPALNVNPTLAAAFKGLTLGATFLETTSGPSVSGFAAAQCEFLGASANPTNAPVPCTAGSLEKSSVSSANQSDGDTLSKCSGTPINVNNVVTLDTVCGKSLSTTTGVSGAGTNEAGVALAKLSLDLTGLQAAIEAAKDTIVTTVQGVVTTVFGSIPGAAALTQPQQDALKSAIGQALESIKQGAKAGAIKSGNSSSILTTEGDVVTLESIGAAAQVGLLGLQDPLVDGLIIIDVTTAKAKTVWNGAAGVVTGSAEPAIATVKVRDFIDLVPNNDYIVATISTQALNTLLAPLKGTVLETTLELATTSVSPPGKSVTASSSGVNIHALKGIGATGGTTAACGTCDGGVILRVASANVSFSGSVSSVQTVPLPVTGGRSWLFYAMMAILAAGAASLFLVARRFRRTPS